MSSRYPSIGIAGTINHDFVHMRGYEYEDLGGILYNILGIHYLSSGLLNIKPVANYGYDIESLLFDYLKNKKNISIDGLNKVNTLNPTVKLNDIGIEGKSEVLKFLVPALSFDQLYNLKNCDIIIINFISGRDIKADTLWKLKESYKGIIYIDIHSLTLGIREDGTRFYRQPGCWKQVFESADIVQMNLKETITTIGEKSRSLDNISESDISRYGKYVLSFGPDIFLLTLGDKGAVSFIRKNDHIDSYYSGPKNNNSPAGEATGCGDVFTSAFVVSILTGSGIEESLDFAVKVASEKFRFPGLRVLSDFSGFARHVPENIRFSIDNIISK